VIQDINTPDFFLIFYIVIYEFTNFSHVDKSYRPSLKKALQTM